MSDNVQAEISDEELEEQLRYEQAELNNLLIQKEQVLKARRLWLFEPSPKQLQFFEHASTKRRAGFCGNRFGKSTIGVVEDVCWLLGYRPFFPEGHALRTAGIPVHGVKGLVISEDWDKVKEIFTNDESEERQGKFFEFLPRDCVKKCFKNEKGIIVQIVVESVVNGVKRESTVFFETVKAYKQNPAAFESSDYDFIHVDEPIPKAMWVAVSRGLIDRGGFAWWLLTPIKEVWMYAEHVAEAALQPQLYWWFEATMDDNPLLSDEDKTLYINQLDEAERDARRRGVPLAYGKLVFSDYKPDYHDVAAAPAGWQDYKPPFDKSCVAYAIDIHPQTPHAVVFAAINADGSIDVYDELFVKCRMYELARMVRARLQGCRVAYGLCEPGAWNEDQGSGVCHADTLADEGLDVVPGSKQKDLAIMLTQQLFKQRTRVVRIHKRCTNLRRELLAHYFDKDDKPVDKDDHLIECLRRLVIHDNLKYYPPYLTDVSPALPDDGFGAIGSDIGAENLNLTRI